ncbi:stalk domain-containing protein [Paenibacillus piri]|uniref:Copper amine oxidase-like N-terminal domain-containing protein n=1 Tax=Paenibacillus piri TaxID=2547395 RepID=A0A4R5KAU9_9BACL|nr:stalk domain-containing protein [Paenibacillus piri]TDF91247.1 hypothetical protein E1757_33260 [Paenibacillus piri]
MRKKMVAGITAAVLALAAVPAAGYAAEPQATYACTKTEVTTPEYDYLAASNVFYGSVLNVESVYFDGIPYRMATFVTDTSLKGAGIKTVLTPQGAGECGYTFEQGHNYLVYANNRLGRPAVSESDVFEGDEAAARLQSLKESKPTPLPDPGVHQVTLYPGENVNVIFEGKKMPVTPAALYFQNSLYVPLTFFRDVLGYITVWNADLNRNEIRLRTDWGGVAAKGDPAQSQFTGGGGIPVGTEPFVAGVTYSDVQAKVDGSLYPPENQPFNYNGVVYVALRSTAERLGIQVNWVPETKTAIMKDISPIESTNRPVLTLKLSSNQASEPDLIVDRIVGDQAQYHYDQPLPYGETPAQMTASFTDLVKETNGVAERNVRLFIRSGERENELIVTNDLMKSILTDPAIRLRLNSVLGTDSFHWPDHGIIGLVHIR